MPLWERFSASQSLQDATSSRTRSLTRRATAQPGSRSMTTIRPKVILPAASALNSRLTYPACISGPPMTMKLGMCEADVAAPYFFDSRTF